MGVADPSLVPTLAEAERAANVVDPPAQASPLPRRGTDTFNCI